LLLDAALKDGKSRRSVARGKLVGAEMAARAAGNYAVKDSKACVIM